MKNLKPGGQQISGGEYVLNKHNNSMNKERTFEAILNISTRSQRTGYTTFILRQAIEEPDCIIVSKYLAQAKNLEHTYNRMLKELSIFKKLSRWISGKSKKRPKFISLGESWTSSFAGLKRCVVIFDNSCFV